MRPRAGFRLRAAASALAAASAAATIVSDGGLRCLFLANGASASAAQLGAGVPALPAAYSGTNLGCSSHGGTVPSIGGVPWPLSSAAWCVVDQSTCPGGAASCGALYAGFGFVDSCDMAYLAWGVLPNAVVLNPATQAGNPYAFYQGQQITIYIPPNQPYVLADELIRVSVGPNPLATGGGGGGGTTANVLVSSSSGLNFALNSGFSNYTVGTTWGTGPGIKIFAGPGARTAGAGVAPGCTGGSCAAGTTTPTTTVSGSIVTIANVTGTGYGPASPWLAPPACANPPCVPITSTLPGGGITILASSITGIDFYDASASTGGSLGSATGRLNVLGQPVSVVYTTLGGSVGAKPTLSFLYNVSSCGGGGGTCVTVNGVRWMQYGTLTAAQAALAGANTVANGAAINWTVSTAFFTGSPPGCTTGGGGGGGGGTTCTGIGLAAGGAARWILGVTLGAITNYSAPFVFVMPVPTPSSSPSTGASATSTQSPTPTATISRGASASNTPVGSPTNLASATPTISVSPTISNSAFPSFSSAPNYAAIASSTTGTATALVGGVVGTVAAVAIIGAAIWTYRQRRARYEARMRMRVSSRRYMGDQSSAYGNVHSDGAVNLGAAAPYNARRPPRAAAASAPHADDDSGIEVRRELSAPSRPARPARSNSLRR